MDGSCGLAALVFAITSRPDSFGLGDDPAGLGDDPAGLGDDPAGLGDDPAGLGDDPAGLGDAGVAWPNPSGSAYELLSRLNCSDDVRNGLLLV